MRRFEEKTALITGAARGLGKATAALFVKEGAKVCIADIDHDEVKKVENELISEGYETISVKADISHLS